MEKVKNKSTNVSSHSRPFSTALRLFPQRKRSHLRRTVVIPVAIRQKDNKSPPSVSRAAYITQLLDSSHSSRATTEGAGTNGHWRRDVALQHLIREHTATGGAALLNTTIGDANTANGAYTLVSNIDGSDNTAMGDQALFSRATSPVTSYGSRCKCAD